MKALVTDHVHPFLLDYFEKRSIPCRYEPSITVDAFEEICHEYEIIIVNSKIKWPKELILKAKKLKLIGRLGSGMDGIDTEFLTASNIHFVRTPEANANAVAEHAIGMLLSLVNNLNKADQEVRNYIWHREKLRGKEITDLTIGVIGFGNTGSLFASKMSCLSQKVLSYDKYKAHYCEEFHNIEEVSLKHLQTNADIISLHIPLTKETHHIVDADFLKECRPGVIIINTSRGPIVNTTDLLEGLIHGQIKGACLDVFENEKPHTIEKSTDQVYRKLYQLPNVVLSPHIAGWTHDSFFKISKVMSEKIDKLLDEIFDYSSTV